MVRVPLEYYLLPIVCAAAGAWWGLVAARSRKSVRSAVWTVAVLACAAVIELLWHETPHLQVWTRIDVVLATALAFAMPALASFVAAWLATRAGWKVLLSFSASALATALALVAYPLYSLYVLCYIGHDCL